MTVKQAAVRLGVSPSLVYAWCRAGVLKHSRFGRPGKRGKIVIDEASLAALAEACTRDGGKPSAPLPLRFIRA